MLRLASILLSSSAVLSALELSQLDGAWVVDGEATWVELQKIPEMQAQFGQLPPDQQEMIKGMMIAAFGQATSTVANGTITATDGKGRQTVASAKDFTSTGPKTADVKTVEDGKPRTAHLTLLDDGRLRIAMINAEAAEGEPKQIVLIQKRR